MKLSHLWILSAAALNHLHFNGCNAQTNVDSLYSARTITAGEQQEALVELILNKTLASAFQTYGIQTLDDKAAVMEMRNSSVTDSSQYDFQFRLNKMLLQLFRDAHTRVEVTKNKENFQSIDMCLKWVANGELGEETWDLISSCDTDYAKRGDYIISMGEITPMEMFGIIKRAIPHENEYFLTGLDESWLVREDFLAYFGMVDDRGNVAVVMERDGIVMDPVDIPLLETFGSKADIRPFVSYEIMNRSRTAVFTLDDCIFNDTFVGVLTDFWSIVLSNPNIENVVIDLRANRGGSFQVAPAFLSFITAEPYELFDILQRVSDDFCIQEPMLCDPGTLEGLTSLGANVTDDYMTIPSSVMSAFFASQMGQPEVFFQGNFFVLTSGVTFSSAHLFAGVVQQNNLGTIVGTPTGNAPSFWGNLVSFEVPNTDLSFYLSTSQTVLAGEGDSIVPDVVVSTTREDILAGRDPQLDFIITNIGGSHSTTVSTDSIDVSAADDDDDDDTPQTMSPTSTSFEDSSSVNLGTSRLLMSVFMLDMVIVL